MRLGSFVVLVFRASALFSQCILEVLQRGTTVFFREPFCSGQHYQHLSEHAERHSLLYGYTVHFGYTNGNNAPQVSKTPPLNNRFRRLMTDQISRALRVIAKYVRSALRPTTLGSDQLTKREKWENLLYVRWRNTQVSDAKVVYTINNKIGPYTGIQIVRTPHGDSAL